MRDSEIVAIWKAVSKADTAGDRVDFQGFCQAFARVDALFEVEEEEEGVVDAGDGDGDDSVREGGAGEGAAGEAEASFLELVGSSEGVLDLAGLLK